MIKTQFKRGDKALVIVAHPDDETIWMGGFILSHPELRWTVFSLCRASDTDRAPKFRRICQALGARAIITDLDDEGRISERQALPQIEKLIGHKIGAKRFDLVFTHGANGEYGHPRHKSVHRTVKKLACAGKIKAEKVLFFNYKKISKYKLTAKKNSDLISKLSSAQFKKKLRLMTDIYGFAPDGIDTGFCTNPEAFQILNKHLTSDN
jgi:LmbE family N-acetylglucosaminyl deacetylase